AAARGTNSKPRRKKAVSRIGGRGAGKPAGGKINAENFRRHSRGEGGGLTPEKSTATVARMDAPLLAVENLSIVRAETTLLDRVNWRVEPGEHWVVLGANGSGKTSLLRALTGYLTASDGDIHLLGEHYGECDWRDLRERVGLVSSALQASIPPGEPALDTVVSGKYAQLDLW